MAPAKEKESAKPEGQIFEEPKFNWVQSEANFFTGEKVAPAKDKDSAKPESQMFEVDDSSSDEESDPAGQTE